MNKPKVSIIVPVFNVKDKLKRCINSLLIQEFDDYEIILVDDGSNDGSELICDEYLEEPCVRVKHMKNEGRVTARNIGISLANGEYICFVDSDDYVSPKFVKLLYDSIYNNSADISVCGINCIYSDKEMKMFDSVPTGVYSKNDIRTNILPTLFYDPKIHDSKVRGSLCNKMINYNFLTSNILSVPNMIERGEDGALIYGLIIECDKIVFLDEALYNYDIYDTERKYEYKKEKTVQVEKLYSYYQDERFNLYQKNICLYLASLIISDYLGVRKEDFKTDINTIKKNEIVCEIIKKCNLNDIQMKYRWILWCVKYKAYFLLHLFLWLRIIWKYND